MKKYFNKAKSFIIAHKIISVIVLIALLGTGYWGYKKVTSTSGDIRYLTTKVAKGNIIASVSGSGQVSASNQVDIKPKTSGDIVYLAAKAGQKVSAGALIATIDSRDAQKSVRDAEISLQSAKLSLEKIQIQNSEANLSADAQKAYTDGFNDVADAFLDLPSVVDGLNDMISQNNLSDNAARAVGNTARTYRDKAETSYYAAKKAFDQNQKDYTALNSNSSPAKIKNIIAETYTTTKTVSDAVKNTLDFVNYMADHANDPDSFTSSKSTLSTYTNTVVSDLTSLSDAQTNISNNKDSSQNASIDMQSAELSVQQKENALQDAKDNLADYSIRAPFAGTLASVDIKKSDSVSASTAAATLITAQQLAEISFNEVDVAKIKLGQKATLTFDAIPDLTISGIVGDIDAIGAVSQGVVTYNVKISFDTQDERVKPGMSVSAEIITNMKQNVLVVPNSAIKSQNGTSYVESFDAPLVPPTDGLIGTISKIAPNKIPVEVGLSNDSESEIISGVTEGDEIVSRTIQSSATTAAAAPSLFGGSGNRATTGGAARTTGR
ncbi:MAG TPA: efflux RND transporter periplasmic adaptor subunit [Candidatus Paceibacterota bacterium]|jgi:HlyD family secretion protein|nr:efflux RND transporter periplasmic adaptor subunit [Candidatus Paceibacterota bacterium]